MPLQRGRRGGCGKPGVPGGVQRVPQQRRAPGRRADGGRRRKPGRAGGRVCRAGKAALFLLHPQFPEPHGQDHEPCQAQGRLCACGAVRRARVGGRPLRGAAHRGRAGAVHQKHGHRGRRYLRGQFFQNFVPGHAPCVLRLRQKADGRLCGGEAVQRRAHQRVGAACMRGHADAHGYGRAHPGDTQNLRGQGGADDGTAG